MDDDLRQHRVVEGRDLRALGETRVRPDSVPLRLVQREDRAARGEEAPRGVLRADAGLDRPAVEPDVVLREGERLAGGHPQLPLHQVDAGDQLGHRVLDLETGVHLHEVVRRRVDARHDELDRARAHVAAGPCRLDRRRTHGGADLGGEEDARRLLDDLLVAALERALALAEVHHVPVGVGEDLDLDVPGPVDPPLHEQRVVAEGRARLTAGRRDLLLQDRQVPDEPHALAAAAGGRLEQDGSAQLAGRLDQFGIGGAGDDGHARRLHGLLRPDLVAHQGDRLGARADEDQTGVGAGPREGGVLREEAVARVHGLCPGAGGGVEERRNRQVGLGGRRRTDPYRRVRLADVPGVGVRVAVDGHRADAELPQGADDADGDLAPVGHEDGVEHAVHLLRALHIRKTPNWGSPRGALAQAVRARPRTCRVSRGSMTPSSHSRAEA
ncbi:hypothetical protein SNARM312S_02144 [Streptomyces narbonensis]